MSRKKTAGIIVLLILAVAVWLVQSPGSQNRLVSPEVSKAAAVPAAQPSLYNPPEEVSYDSSTDLKKELEGINPAVLDEDFDF